MTGLLRNQIKADTADGRTGGCSQHINQHPAWPRGCQNHQHGVYAARDGNQNRIEKRDGKEAERPIRKQPMRKLPEAASNLMNDRFQWSGYYLSRSYSLAAFTAARPLFDKR